MWAAVSDWTASRTARRALATSSSDAAEAARARRSATASAAARSTARTRHAPRIHGAIAADRSRPSYRGTKAANRWELRSSYRKGRGEPLASHFRIRHAVALGLPIAGLCLLLLRSAASRGGAGGGVPRRDAQRAGWDRGRGCALARRHGSAARLLADGERARLARRPTGVRDALRPRRRSGEVWGRVARERCPAGKGRGRDQDRALLEARAR